MAITGARHQISAELLSWEGINAAPHRFGGTEYRLGRREIGNIHGDAMVDIPFPTKLHNELVQNGQAQAHHILPNSGWISFYIKNEQDVQHAIDLLRKSYEAATNQQAPRKT